MLKIFSIHPFPARMAPEIVFSELEGLPEHQRVLDPMSGSGTVLRGAVELGHQAIGFDLDPLAVLMARVWTTPISSSDLTAEAKRVVQEAKSIDSASLPWVDLCQETQNYISFWFEPAQEKPLRRIASVLHSSVGPVADALRLALSRIVVTKGKGASVARDTSHSRPHRVYFENDYDVYEGFILSAKRLADRLSTEKLIGSASIQLGDSRSMASLATDSVDVVITSPPYLNAIDYLRGHRLALVWLGHSVSEVRGIRSRSIGAESSSEHQLAPDLMLELLAEAGEVNRLPKRSLGMIKRYAQDVYGFVSEIQRVTKKNGRVLLVVGDSCLQGVPVLNARICEAAGKLAGLTVVERTERELPSANRYLPTPTSGSLGARMKKETLLSFSC